MASGGDNRRRKKRTLTVPVDVVPEPVGVDGSGSEQSGGLRRAMTIRTGPPPMDSQLSTPTKDSADQKTSSSESGPLQAPDLEQRSDEPGPPAPSEERPEEERPVTVDLDITADELADDSEEHGDAEELVLEDIEEISTDQSTPPTPPPIAAEGAAKPSRAPSGPSGIDVANELVAKSGAGETAPTSEELPRTGKSVEISFDELEIPSPGELMSRSAAQGGRDDDADEGYDDESDEYDDDDYDDDDDDDDDYDDDEEDAFDDENVVTIRRESIVDRDSDIVDAVEVDPDDLAADKKVEDQESQLDEVVSVKEKEGDDEVEHREKTVDASTAEESDERPILDLDTGEIASKSSMKAVDEGESQEQSSEGDATPDESDDTKSAESDSAEPPTEEDDEFDDDDERPTIATGEMFADSFGMSDDDEKSDIESSAEPQTIKSDQDDKVGGGETPSAGEREKGTKEGDVATPESVLVGVIQVIGQGQSDDAEDGALKEGTKGVDDSAPARENKESPESTSAATAKGASDEEVSERTTDPDVTEGSGESAEAEIEVPLDELEEKPRTEEITAETDLEELEAEEVEAAELKEKPKVEPPASEKTKVKGKDEDASPAEKGVPRGSDEDAEELDLSDAEVLNDAAEKRTHKAVVEESVEPPPPPVESVPPPPPAQSAPPIPGSVSSPLPVKSAQASPAPGTKSPPAAQPASAASKPTPAAPPPPPAGPKPRRARRKPWWEEMFNDDYLRSLPDYSKRQTQKEVDFLESALGIKAGGMILDLACGNGRHAVELSTRGYQVVGLDLSLPMLARAAELAQKNKQKINFIHGDMRQIAFESTFDGACCLGTSMGYFDDETNIKVIEGIHKSLKSRGMLLIEVANRDFLIMNQPNMVWFEGDGCVCMEESSFNFITSRLRVKRTLLLEGGRQVEHEFSLRTYCIHELGMVLHNAGFRVIEVSGHIHTPGAFFGPDSPNLIILAEKRA